jgi:hypothetical protein
MVKNLMDMKNPEDEDNELASKMKNPKKRKKYQDLQLQAREQGKTKKLQSGMFKHSVSPNSELLDEVDKYLLLPVEDQTLEPLSWWKSHAQQFPLLSIVAKCILGIPASSVSVERTFNMGRDVIGIRRHALKSGTISALMFGKYMLLKNK